MRRYRSIFLLLILAGVLVTTNSFSNKEPYCSCGPLPSVEEEFASSDLVIRGRLIAYDTISYDNAAWLDTKELRFGFGKTRFKPVAEKDHFLRGTIVVDVNYKPSATIKDTIYVVTTQGSGSCGYNLPPYYNFSNLPEDLYDFIIYGNRYSYGSIEEIKDKKKKRLTIVSHTSFDIFVTSTCKRTRRASDKDELAALAKLRN